ncbi:hypothetical protein [Nitratireductor luteus]|nr:hypothetical protein [Nitratireductor luteus]
MRSWAGAENSNSRVPLDDPATVHGDDVADDRTPSSGSTFVTPVDCSHAV